MKKYIKILIVIVFIIFILITAFILNYNKGYIFLALNKNHIDIYVADPAIDEEGVLRLTKLFKVNDTDKEHLLELFDRKNYKAIPFESDHVGASYSFILVNTKTNEEIVFTASNIYIQVASHEFLSKDSNNLKKIQEIYKLYKPEGPRH